MCNKIHSLQHNKHIYGLRLGDRFRQHGKDIQTITVALQSAEPQGKQETSFTFAVRLPPVNEYTIQSSGILSYFPSWLLKTKQT